MADKPSLGTLYVVSEFRADRRWHELLATRNEAEALALLRHLGSKGKIEETTPRKPKWR